MKLNFDPAVVTKDGENGLHALIYHFYRVGNMKQCGGFMAIEKRLEVFEDVVNTLGPREPKIFSVKEKRKGRTPLHIAAESVVCTSRHARVDGRCDPLKRTRYFQRCLECMLGHLLQLKHNSMLTNAQLIETVSAQDNDGNTILHTLAGSSSFPGWESIQYVLKNFNDSVLPSIKNKESKTAFEILSGVNAAVARKLFHPDGNAEDVFVISSSPNCEQQQQYEASVSPVVTSTPHVTSNSHDTEIAVKAVWSEAEMVERDTPRGTQHGSSLKSLESVVMSLHNTAKGTASHHTNTGDPVTQHPGTGNQASPDIYNGSSSDEVVFVGRSHGPTNLEMTAECRDDSSSSCLECESLSLSPNGIPAHTSDEDFASQGLSSDDPYPVFLPNFPVSRSEKDCTNSSPCETVKQEIDLTYSPCSVSPLPRNSLEVENHVSASPSSPHSMTQGHEAEESVAIPTKANGLSHLDSAMRYIAGKDRGITLTADSQIETPIKENSKAASTGDSAFFDFLLTQGSEFNPAMKFQIVELIKSEFGKKMASFDSEICQTETEKRRLEAEIHNSKLKLQQKEEEKLRLFAEIENLQKSIVEATEKHKILAQHCTKLREESSAVKRKISSCEEVEREMCGSPAKTNKSAEG